MKLEKFKEKDKKKIGIILFTIICIMLISGVILYRTFAIFETNNNLDLIKGNIQNTGDIEFAFYINGNISKNAPEKESGYSLDISSSYCKDVLNGSQISNINWNDEKWSVEIKGVSTTKTKCYLYFKEIYKESILNGAIPDLGNGRLIPITISNSEKPNDVTSYTNNENKYGGKVYKADITTDWYSYNDKRWANAVILKDGVVDNYKPGDEIEEKDIESYFVWIPRYRYQLKANESDYDKYTEVIKIDTPIDNNDSIEKLTSYEIIFETKNDGIQNGNIKNSWLTHPAFISFNSNGMWVGKFETGYDGAINILDAEKDERDISKIIIKPNVYSWRSIKVGTAFYNSYDYQRDLESHMMKNMEWGAVTYLTNSQYGKCNETKCEEVRMNNNGNYVTGYSASFEPTCGYTGTNEDCNKYESIDLSKDGEYGWSYYNSQSVVASTTGNYYGVFDMAGGSWEYVMGVMQSSSTNANPASGRSSTYNSGFKGPYSSETGTNDNGLEWPSSKYYDLYDYSISEQQFQRGHLGDATKELGPFYSVRYNYGTSKPTRNISSYADRAYFIYNDNPWFVRSTTTTSGDETGVAAFDYSHGMAASGGSFRLVLMP